MKGFRAERRRPRYPVNGLRGKFLLETHADLLNVSLFGMAVRSPISLEVGREVAFELGAEPDAVGLKGMIRWCRAASRPRGTSSDLDGYFDTGVTFNEDLLQKADDLLRFLDNITILKLTKGIYGRFELDYEVPLTLQHRQGFRVNELSHSGMLVETDATLAAESRVDLEMSLNGRRFFSRGRVVQIKNTDKGESVGPTRMGVELFQPTERQIQILHDYIQAELGGTP